MPPPVKAPKQAHRLVANASPRIAAGRIDPIVRPEESERLAALLREAGAEVSLHWEMAGHTISREQARLAREWLAQR